MCEYEVVSITDTDCAGQVKAKLNELAAEGYQLKHCDCGHHGVLLILEREAKEATHKKHHKAE